MKTKTREGSARDGHSRSGQDAKNDDGASVANHDNDDSRRALEPTTKDAQAAEVTEKPTTQTGEESERSHSPPIFKRRRRKRKKEGQDLVNENGEANHTKKKRKKKKKNDAEVQVATDVNGENGWWCEHLTPDNADAIAAGAIEQKPADAEQPASVTPSPTASARDPVERPAATRHVPAVRTCCAPEPAAAAEKEIRGPPITDSIDTVITTRHDYDATKAAMPSGGAETMPKPCVSPPAGERDRLGWLWWPKYTAKTTLAPEVLQAHISSASNGQGPSGVDGPQPSNVPQHERSPKGRGERSAKVLDDESEVLQATSEDQAMDPGIPQGPKTTQKEIEESPGEGAGLSGRGMSTVTAMEPTTAKAPQPTLHPSYGTHGKRNTDGTYGDQVFILWKKRTPTQKLFCLLDIDEDGYLGVSAMTVFFLIGGFIRDTRVRFLTAAKKTAQVQAQDQLQGATEQYAVQCRKVQVDPTRGIDEPGFERLIAGTQGMTPERLNQIFWQIKSVRPYRKAASQNTPDAPTPTTVACSPEGRGERSAKALDDKSEASKMAPAEQCIDPGVLQGPQNPREEIEKPPGKESTVFGRFEGVDSTRPRRQPKPEQVYQGPDSSSESSSESPTPATIPAKDTGSKSHDSSSESSSESHTPAASPAKDTGSKVEQKTKTEDEELEGEACSDSGDDSFSQCESQEATPASRRRSPNAPSHSTRHQASMTAQGSPGPSTLQSSTIRIGSREGDLGHRRCNPRGSVQIELQRNDFGERWCRDVGERLLRLEQEAAAKNRPPAAGPNQRRRQVTERRSRSPRRRRNRTSPDYSGDSSPDNHPTQRRKSAGASVHGHTKAAESSRGTQSSHASERPRSRPRCVLRPRSGDVVIPRERSRSRSPGKQPSGRPKSRAPAPTYQPKRDPRERAEPQSQLGHSSRMQLRSQHARQTTERDHTDHRARPGQEWQQEHWYGGHQQQKELPTTQATPLANLNMVELLLRATSDAHGVWNDPRVKTIVDEVVPHRVGYLQCRCRSLNSEISREEANKLATTMKWSCLGWMVAHKPGQARVAKKTFENYLTAAYGGYKIVLLVLRLGYLNPLLLEVHAQDILSHSQLGPIPLSLHPHLRLWNYNAYRMYKCVGCTKDFATAVQCRRCKAAFGNCCASADRSLCKFCFTADADSAVERMVHAYHHAANGLQKQTVQACRVSDSLGDRTTIPPWRHEPTRGKTTDGV
jgi:hypothetical protein